VKVEIKNLHYYEGRFTLSLYADGVRVGEVRRVGRNLPMTFSGDKEKFAAIDAYGETLSPRVSAIWIVMSKVDAEVRHRGYRDPRPTTLNLRPSNLGRMMGMKRW
jgi:hypothetical protein